MLRQRLRGRAGAVQVLAEGTDVPVRQRADVRPVVGGICAIEFNVPAETA